MKDVQGVQRGRCNANGCECEEYRTSSQQSSLRCEYCNHTPAEHVKIIELGACSICGKDECDKYQSENPNKYTDCEYCGCSAQMHSGAEKLRKPQSQQPGASLMSGRMMPQAVSGGDASFQPRHDARNQPVQQAAYGVCKCPGCQFPKRKEGDKLHDFCSKTCAKKYSDLQTNFYQQKVAASKTAQSSSPKGSITSQQPPGGCASSVPPTSIGPTSAFKKIAGQGSPSTPSYPQSSGPMPTSMAGGKMCSKCRVRQANPGKGWCQQCFTQS